MFGLESIALILLALPPGALAPVSPQAHATEAKATANLRADRLAALEKEYEDARSAYYAARRAAKTDEERQKLAWPDAKTWAPRFWELVREDSLDETALDALSWLIEESPSKVDLADAVATIEKHHLKSPRLAELCATLGGKLGIGTSLLERIAAENPDRAVQGFAVYAIASHRLESARTAKSIRKLAEPDQKSVRESLGEERLAELKILDVERAEAEATRLLERVEKDYDDVKSGDSTLGERAHGDLHELRDLAVGQAAPEIEAQDLDAVVFKLSDYRGKVLLLDFWGNW